MTDHVEEAIEEMHGWRKGRPAISQASTLPRLTFDRLRMANAYRCGESFHPIKAWSPTDWACALAGEVGEACNLVKKLRRLDTADAAHDTPAAREALTRQIAAELGDVIAYADLLATRLGIDLGEAVARKFNVVSERVGSDVRLP